MAKEAAMMTARVWAFMAVAVFWAALIWWIGL
jgi:hypothetical protein